MKVTIKVMPRKAWTIYEKEGTEEELMEYVNTVCGNAMKYMDRPGIFITWTGQKGEHSVHLTRS